MAVEQVPTQYRTSDGKQFKTAGEAERHERLITAQAKYEEAQREFRRAMAETQRTADGRLFEFGMLRDYYCIEWGAAGPPYLRTVSFYVWDCRVHEDNGHVYVTERDGKADREHRISSLYASEREAKRELLRLTTKWLAEETEKVAKLRAEVGDE